jgi:hypothetical protein
MSLVETMVAMTLFLVVTGIITAAYFSGHRVFQQDSLRIQQNDAARLAVWEMVKDLRDSAAVIHTNDLDHNGVTDSSPLGVNFKLNNTDGSPLVRDALLVYTDSTQGTIYYDGDGVGKPGSGYPDFVHFDDADGDGHADVLGVGLVAQDDNRDGQQDFIDANEDGTADDVVKGPSGVTDGRPDMLWKLVVVHFGNIGQVTQQNLWKNGKVVAKNIVPFITNAGTSTESYDTISYNGCCVDSYDYGMDGVFATSDTGENDGVVEEYEIACADPAGASTQMIDTANEIMLIGGIKFNLRLASVVERRRVDVNYVKTMVAPRGIAIVHRLKLIFPVPG